MSSRIAVAVMAALLLLYIALVAQRAWLLLVSGDPVGVAMGAVLVVLPVIAIWALARELWFGVRAEQLGRSPYRTCQILYDEYEGEAGKQRQQLITPVEAAEHDNLECHTDEPDRNGGKRQGQPESGNLVEW